LEQVEAQISSVPEVSFRVEELVHETGFRQQVVDNLKMQLEKVQQELQKDFRATVIVERAWVPDKPVFPILSINLLVAFASALVAGVFYSFVLEYVRIRIPQRRR
jgi:uncharacterized protein involved in exopolysaccharide biosynthesis